MKKPEIAVLFGGCSPEYKVSLQSAYSIIQHADQERFTILPIGITKEGWWFRYYGDADKILEDTWLEEGPCVPASIVPSREIHGILEYGGGKAAATRIDAALPVLHGKNGEDGTVQGLLELAGIPVIGCGTLCSALSMDKSAAHTIAQSAGVAVPAFVILSSPEELPACKEVDFLRYPLYVKPVRGGSSIGMTRVGQSYELKDAVDKAFQYDTTVIIEEGIPGFEVGCAVLETDSLVVGAVDEIELNSGFFDYREKYSLETAKIHMPARISEAKSDEIKAMALKIYRALGCKGFARVDMFLTPQGEIVFNEVNTIPGFTPHSRFPQMLGGIGLAFGDMVNQILERGMK